MENVIGWAEIPLSDKGKQYLTSLKEGVCVIVRAKRVNSSVDGMPKIQIEFAEKINNPNRGKSGLAMLNSDDSRFSTGAQRAWITASPAKAKELLGIEIPNGESFTEILQPCPTVGDEEFHLQYDEILESELTENEAAYAENYLKRAGAEGNYFYAGNGQRVASRKTLVVTPKGTVPSPKYIEGSFASAGSVESTLQANRAALNPEVSGTGN